MGNSPQTLQNHLSKRSDTLPFLNASISFKRSLLSLLAIFTISIGLSACAFKPLYGPTASNQQLNTVLAGISVPEVRGRPGQQIRNELIFRFTGGGHPAQTQYRLVLVVGESVTAQLVQKDGDSQAQIYQLTTNFKLFAVSDDKNPLIKGTSYAKATFEDLNSVYANVRARRDAENRTAKTTADDIQGRIAAFLSGNS